MTVKVVVAGEEPVICTDVAEQDASLMLEGTEQVNVIEPLNPLIGEIVRAAVADCPAADNVIGDTTAGKTKSVTASETVFTAVV